MAVFPLPRLADGRRARVSSGFGEIRRLRRRDARKRGLDEIPDVDPDDPRTFRRHMGADITFRRLLPAAMRRPGVPRGESSPIDPLDGDAPNAPGEGFPRSFVPRGWPVLATERGTVIRRGQGNGTYVALLHRDSPIDGGNSTVYVHLDEAVVDVGDQVAEGQRIGTAGAGTHGGRRHLHLDRRSGADERTRGVQIDPGPYLAETRHVRDARAPWIGALLSALVVAIARALRGRHEA